MSETIIQQIIERLLASKGVLLTGHVNPDGDSLGSLLGMAGMFQGRGIPHAIINEGEIPDKYLFLPGINQIQDAACATVTDRVFDTTVVVECSHLDRIGRVRQLIATECTIINIDHHQDNVPFGHLNLKIPEAAAAGEIIYDLLRHGSIPITPAMATALYTAILTDTGRFHYNSTTPHCLRVAADLVELGADPTRITEEVYFKQTPSRLLLTGLALSTMEYLAEGRLCVMTIDLNMMHKAGASNGDTEGLVNNSMAAAGVQIGALIYEVDDRVTKVSLRSQDGIDVAAIAAHYGGGGHCNASGFTLPLSLPEARPQVIGFLKEKLHGPV